MEASRYNLDILAIQETRWIGTGNIDKGDYKFIYGGTDKHTFGTGFLIKKRFQNSIQDVKFINDRISYLIIRGNFKPIFILNAHAPTEDKDQETKDEFYEALDDTLDSFNRYGAKILMGDMNAKLGHEVMYKPVLGNHSLHENSNENGIRLLEFALSKNMFVKSTMFPHKRIHKGTWISPDGHTVNQIDHVLINRRWHSDILDVRTFRNADIDSDHMLVIIKLRERISSQKTKKIRQRKLDQDKLKDPITLRQFQHKIEEKIQNTRINTNESKTIEDDAEKITKTLHDGAKEVIGFTKNKRERQWFDEECKTAIEQRKMRRRTAIERRDTPSIEEYREERRRTKKLIRRKKREHINKKLEQIEKEDSMKNVRSFYQLVNQQRRGTQPKSTMIKDKNGTILTGNESIRERWAEYFKELLNVEQEQQTEEITPETAEVEDEPPTMQEIENAIKRLKNNKTPGSDEITSELLKKGGSTIKEELHKLITKCWKEEIIPNKWKEVIIIPLHKKNDPTDCNNYRGIALLNTAYKVLSLILLSRIEAYSKDQIGEYQAGFRKNRSTTDQIHALRNILERRTERDIDTFILFIDFKKSYDCLIRNEIWNAMHELGIPKKLIRMVKECALGSVNRVRVAGEVSSAFTVESGLKQGDGLSPLLFNITLEKVIKDLWKDEILVCKLLAYADDIAMLGNNLEEIEECLKVLEKKAEKVGLKMNTDKTKFMHVSKIRSMTSTTVTINNHRFERVTDFKYLGANINENNRIEPEVNNRMNNANRSLYSMNKMLTSKKISKNAKIKMYTTIIQPVLLYGSETWPLKQNIILRVQAFENKVLRKISGPILDEETHTWRRRKNRELELLYKKPPISNIIKAKILQWAGHVTRADPSSNIKRALDLQINKPRAVGRPRNTWEGGVKEILKEFGVGQDWQTIAQDRHEWRRLVSEVKDPRGL
ncbi:hypothetical protein M8J77_000982 [Diaphorina citri]|nr:hypothetical protein M8J77_000982 [Diaphorina citri]